MLELKGKAKYDAGSADYREGWGDGIDDMKKMVLTVFREHPELGRDEIYNYIKDNL